MEGMVRHCKKVFGNGTACNAPYYRVAEADGIVHYYNGFGREIRYCPTCGSEIAPMENPAVYAPRAELPGLTRSAKPFEIEFADNAPQAMRSMADI
jgi:hypothetical protein